MSAVGSQRTSQQRTGRAKAWGVCCAVYEVRMGQGGEGVPWSQRAWGWSSAGSREEPERLVWSQSGWAGAGLAFREKDLWGARPKSQESVPRTPAVSKATSPQLSGPGWPLRLTWHLPPRPFLSCFLTHPPHSCSQKSTRPPPPQAALQRGSLVAQLVKNLPATQELWVQFLGLEEEMATHSSISSVQFSRSVVSDSLRPHGLQHSRLPCPSPAPRAYSNSRSQRVGHNWSNFAHN